MYFTRQVYWTPQQKLWPKQICSHYARVVHNMLQAITAACYMVTCSTLAPKAKRRFLLWPNLGFPITTFAVYDQADILVMHNQKHHVTCKNVMFTAYNMELT